MGDDFDGSPVMGGATVEGHKNDSHGKGCLLGGIIIDGVESFGLGIIERDEFFYR